jgi:adenosylcobinamide-phosphate synthase
MLGISVPFAMSHQILHLTTNLSILAGALLVEAAVGYPTWLYRAIRHPVVWIGTLLGWLDQWMNDDRASDSQRRGAGVLALAIILAVAVPPAAAIQAIAVWAQVPVLLMLLGSSLLAQRSLYMHVQSVASALEHSGIAGGRAAVAHVVGRNPQALDEFGVVRAAIESLAENFSDAVVAPAAWCLLFGLPGMVAYKTINTADSMIGHHTPRYAAFGWAAARLDDLVNLPASRIAALWLVLAALLHPGAHPGAAWRAVWRDAQHHRSPNAGWPEAAMAGALGLRLAGPRVYGTTRVDDAWMGDGRAQATASDLRRALSLYRLACGLQIATIVALAIIVRG